MAQVVCARPRLAEQRTCRRPPPESRAKAGVARATFSAIMSAVGIAVDNIEFCEGVCVPIGMPSPVRARGSPADGKRCLGLLGHRSCAGTGRPRPATSDWALCCEGSRCWVRCDRRSVCCRARLHSATDRTGWGSEILPALLCGRLNLAHVRGQPAHGRRSFTGNVTGHDECTKGRHHFPFRRQVQPRRRPGARSPKLGASHTPLLHSRSVCHVGMPE